MTVAEYVPLVVEEPTSIVIVDAAEPGVCAGGVTEVELKVAAVPVGRPETARSTAELNPFSEITVMVELSDVPWTMAKEFGSADIKKSGVVTFSRMGAF